MGGGRNNADFTKLIEKAEEACEIPSTKCWFFVLISVK